MTKRPWQPVEIDGTGDVVTAHLMSRRLDEDLIKRSETILIAVVQGARKLAVDCSGVEYMLSTFVGTMLRLQQKACGQLVFYGINENIMDVFLICKLDEKLTFRATASEAFAALA